jgi:Flp pilus assembly protein TadB
MRTLSDQDINAIVDALQERIFGGKVSVPLIQARNGGDLEAAMDAREREIRSRKGGRIQSKKIAIAGRSI